MQLVAIRGAIKCGKVVKTEQPLEQINNGGKEKVTGKSWKNNILAWGDSDLTGNIFSTCSQIAPLFITISIKTHDCLQGILNLN